MKIIILILILIITSCSDDDTVNVGDSDNKKFCYDIDEMPVGLEGTYVRIVALLPNPDGEDDYNEKFRIKNYDKTIENINGYYIKDGNDIRWDLVELDNDWIFDAIDSKCGYYEYTSDKTAQLNNTGDSVYLYNSVDLLIHSIKFGPATSGEWVIAD